MKCNINPIKLSFCILIIICCTISDIYVNSSSLKIRSKHKKHIKHHQSTDEVAQNNENTNTEVINNEINEVEQPTNKNIFIEKNSNDVNSNDLNSNDVKSNENSEVQINKEKSEIDNTSEVIQNEKQVFIERKSHENPAPEPASPSPAAAAVPVAPVQPAVINVQEPVKSAPPSPFPENTREEKSEFLNIKDKDGYSKDTKCDKKTGLLYTIKDSRQRDLNDPTKYIYSHVVTPVYVILNTNSFSISTNTSPESIIRSLILEKIDKIKQTYKNTACFDLIDDQKSSKPLTVCASTKSEMDSWIVSILTYKECIIKDVKIIDANKNAFKKPEINGPPKNPLTHLFGPLSRKKIGNKTISIQTEGTNPNLKAEARDPYFYTNEHKKDAQTAEVEESDETLTRILNDRKRLELAQRQIKRQVEDKIRKVKEAHKKIIERNKLLARRNYLNKKKELAAITKKIEDGAKKEEGDILKGAMEKLTSMDVIFYINLATTIIFIQESYQSTN
jgi:hypothetical protein